VAKTNCEETPVVPAKVGTARESMRSKAQPIQSSQVVQQPQHVQTTASSPVSATVPSPSSAVGRESPLVLQRLSTEEKSSTPLPLASPNLPLASPNSVKSPKPRTRRSTGGKSRESEEESPDTLQKINLILEQAKQEAERSQAHQSQAQHQLVSLPVPFRPAEGGALLAAQPGAPVQDLRPQNWTGGWTSVCPQFSDPYTGYQHCTRPTTGPSTPSRSKGCCGSSPNRCASANCLTPKTRPASQTSSRASA
jgi:hypothetical protein